MIKIMQLILLCAFLLSRVQTGAAQCDAFSTTEISEAVFQGLAPFMNEMRSRLDTVKNELTRIEDKVDDLNTDLNEKKEQTTSELVGLRKKINDSMTSLTQQFQSKLASFDTSITEQHRELKIQLSNDVASELDKINFKLDLLGIDQDKLDAKVTIVNSDLEQAVLTNFTKELQMTDYSYGSPTQSSLHVLAIDATIKNGFRVIKNLIEKHRNDTVGQFDELDIPSHEELTEELVSLNTSMTEYVSWIKKDLDSLNDTISTFINLTKPSTASCEGGYTCGGEGGWRRAVYLNMADPNTNCPTGWQLIGFPIRTCGKVNTGSLTCDSVFFPVTGGEYNRVCGSIRAYQDDYIDAFEAYDEGQVTTIDDAYVAGVSLTHGSPRQHIWTFAAGATEDNPFINDACPCDATGITISIPPFVGEDYFCESGVNFGTNFDFRQDDPLWDGQNCTSTSTCCEMNNPPYFTKQLSSSTTDALEARLCRYDSTDDSPVEFIELYVKGPSDGDCVSEQDPLESRLDEFTAALSIDHSMIRDDIEEHKNHVNSELIQLENNQVIIDSKIDSLDSKQDELTRRMTSITSQLQQTRNDLIESIFFCAPGSGDIDDTCGGEGGWRRVMYLDMTDPNTGCPSGWQLTEYSNRTNACGKTSSGSLTCDSVFFPVTGQYTKVCGTIIGYQNSHTDAFEAFDDEIVTSIDEAYVSGVSLTHGSPRQHIWTFAAGRSEIEPTWDDACPCDATIPISIPPFVGEDYFCESGTNFGEPDGFHPDDPLWDGDGCTRTSTCCSFNNPPYFKKQLSGPTSDDIEARICQWDNADDTPIEFIELFVK